METIQLTYWITCSDGRAGFEKAAEMQSGEDSGGQERGQHRKWKREVTRNKVERKRKVGKSNAVATWDFNLLSFTLLYQLLFDPHPHVLLSVLTRKGQLWQLIWPFLLLNHIIYVVIQHFKELFGLKSLSTIYNVKLFWGLRVLCAHISPIKAIILCIYNRSSGVLMISGPLYRYLCLSSVRGFSSVFRPQLDTGSAITISWSLTEAPRIE